MYGDKSINFCFSHFNCVITNNLEQIERNHIFICGNNLYSGFDSNLRHWRYLNGMIQKDRISRTLIKFYKIFQNRHSPISFTEVCDRYILAHSETIEGEKQLADRINEIKIEYQDLGEEQFISKYGTKLD